MSSSYNQESSVGHSDGRFYTGFHSYYSDNDSGQQKFESPSQVNESLPSNISISESFFIHIFSTFSTVNYLLKQYLDTDYMNQRADRNTDGQIQNGQYREFNRSYDGYDHTYRPYDRPASRSAATPDRFNIVLVLSII